MIVDLMILVLALALMLTLGSILIFVFRARRPEPVHLDNEWFEAAERGEVIPHTHARVIIDRGFK